VSGAVAARLAGPLSEAAKLPAFLRRDLLVALSYRAAFAGDLVQIALQALLFSFIGELVDPATLPTYGGTRAGYMEFVAIGIILSLVTGLLLQRVATAVRQEQMIGTLESLLTTPTSTATIQFGSAAFDPLFMPVRMALLLLAIGLAFGLDFHADGVAPALAVFAAFVPFVWGLGLVSAGAILTFRRGIGLMGAVITALGLASGAYFPLALLPGWLQTVAEANPIAIAIGGVREALIGGAGWDAVGPDVGLLVLLSAGSLVAGLIAFRLALARERRLGTLGLY
jgi:ABC-2 type transport system permease protein